MNRSRYIPFERNRYFYGKLLTVRDFMSEQTYFSDKRRLTNRLLFGSGVIAGLQVVAVDDKSITLETGAALDQMGREIVVPSPITLKLSNVDGFTNNDYAKSVYLCLAYDEKGKESVHTVAGLGGSEGDSEHNRILESYRVFIREQPPAPSWQEYDYLIEDTSIWYDDGQVRVLQTVPRYIEPGQSFEICLTVEKTLQTPHISFEYAPELLHVEAIDDLIDGKLMFSEPTDGGATSYKRRYRMRALSLEGGENKQFAQVQAKSGTARLIIGDKLIYELSHIKQTLEVSEEPVQQRILEAFYSRTLDRAIDSPAEPCLYLAKINLLQMGASYVIDHVERLPFKDYVINPTVLYKLLSANERGEGQQSSEERQVNVHEPVYLPQSPFPDIKQEFISMLEEEEEPEQQVATGIAEISIVPEEKKKWYHRRQKNFYSEEIEHGLGQGVAVLLSGGISDEKSSSDFPSPEMWTHSNAIFSGVQEVFADSEFESSYPRVSIGFIQYSKKGTFRIGIRVQQKTERIRIRIRWWAVKAVENNDAVQRALDEIEMGMDNAATSKS
jgi:hypothetical protein